MADELLAAIDEAIAAAVACACGCGKEITEASPSTWFASAGCQARWTRASHGEVPEWSTTVEPFGAIPPTVPITPLFTARPPHRHRCPHCDTYSTTNIHHLALHAAPCRALNGGAP